MMEIDNAILYVLLRTLEILLLQRAGLLVLLIIFNKQLADYVRVYVIKVRMQIPRPVFALPHALLII